MADVLRAELQGHHLASSLLIHQLVPSVQPVLANMTDLWSMAAAAMGNKEATANSVRLDHVEGEPGDLSALHAVTTVAEVAVPGCDGATEAAVSHALDEAIEHVRFVQRTVALATQRGVVLMSKATLPPFVPTFRGRAFSTQPPEVDEALQFLIPDCAPPAALNLTPELYDEETLAKIDGLSEQLSRGDAFTTYTDLRREALTQRYYGGNHRMALVALASAGEVLLDTVLLYLLWEEHTSPEDAALVFDRSEGHTARVARNLPPRLGGGWDATARTPAGAYLRDLVRLRHRVIHTGHDPSLAELDAAWSALFDLEHYLGDRLVAGPNLKRYTRTAMAWMGQDGLRRRSRFTRHVEQLIHDPAEPLWIEAFGRWRHHVDRALDDSPTPPSEGTPDLMLYAEIDENGTIRWIVHDIGTAYATVVNPERVRTTEQIQRTEALLARRRSDDLADRRIGSLLDAPAPQSQVWVPDHEVFPELTLFPGTATSPPP